MARETPFERYWNQLCAAATPDEHDELLALHLSCGPGGLTLERIAELASDDQASVIASVANRLSSPPPRLQGTPINPAAYDRHKDRVNARQSLQSAESRDIGPLPPVVNPSRRAACLADPLLFLETYFPKVFKKKWAAIHRKVIRAVETVVKAGGLYALALPRASGKSAIMLRLALWAILAGHHRYAILINATEGKARKQLDQLWRELGGNTLLREDFPEVCYPIACLGKQLNKKNGQHIAGVPTAIEFNDTQIVFPTVEGSPFSGCVIESGGLGQAVRGAQWLTPDGELLRPSLILPDDPQTRESAKSPEMSQTILDTLTGDVLGLAGPGVPVSMLLTGTVIYKGDAVDALLDPAKFPHIRSHRCKMLLSMPKRMDLWEEFNEILCRCLQADDDTIPPEERIRPATEFYVERRAEMDEGAEVYWEERFEPGEASAIQHAMTLYFRAPVVFASEYQNEPIALQDDEEFASREEIAVKLSGYDHRVVPPNCQWVTAFIDVHDRILYWMVCAWERNFTGYVIDYGVFPKQPRATFVQARARPTLKDRFPNRPKEGSIYAGLDELVTTLMGTTYHRVGGAEMRIARLGIDAGSGSHRPIVLKVCRENVFAPSLIPTHGQGIGPGRKPIHDYENRSGWFIGDEWYFGPPEEGLRLGKFDKGHWTTIAQRRLSAPIGDPGCVALFGRRENRVSHDFLARHLTAEIRTIIQGDRRIDLWAPRPGETENHWADCYTVNCVLASMCGAKVLRVKAADDLRPKKRKKRKARSLG